MKVYEVNSLNQEDIALMDFNEALKAYKVELKKYL